MAHLRQDVGSSIHVFRARAPVSLKEPLPSPAQVGPEVPTAKRRLRPHTKSRGGCKACRNRRRKCDERQPGCGYCVSRGVACEYRAPVRETSTQVSHTIPPPSASLWPGQKTPLVLAQSKGTSFFTPHDLYLLHHYKTVTSQQMGAQLPCDIHANAVIDVALTSPLLMHAVLAVSAAQRQDLGGNGRAYQLPAALHIQQVVIGLRQSVNSIKDSRDSDAIFTAGMLLNTFEYHYIDEDTQNGHPSTMVNRRPLDWLRIQILLGPLFMHTKPWHDQSIWKEVFIISANNAALVQPSKASTRTEQLLRRLCNIGKTSSATNPYARAFTWLQPLLHHQPSVRFTTHYMRWIVALSNGFVDLLQGGDVPALTLFAHWLHLLSPIDLWWCVRRTRMESRRVCKMLDGKLVGEMSELLEAPARACGYELKHKRRRGNLAPVIL